MTRKNWWKYLCLVICCVWLSGCSLLDNILFEKTIVPEFSFSGYVSADGSALEGATVDCGLRTCTTDETGYFKFEKINKTVQVSVSKLGYLFADDLVFVNSTSSSVDFKGYKLFDKDGVVKNNDVVISDVDIVATSVNGTYTTKSNKDGKFFLPNLAGQVEVTASKQDYVFFKRSFTIADQNTVVITGVTNIKGKIVVDSITTPQDFTLEINNEPIEINSDLEFVANSVEPGTTLKLKSDKFFIKNPEIKIESIDEPTKFDCEKFYDIQGSVKCGNQVLSDSYVLHNGNRIESNDGKFELKNLHGQVELSASKQGFDFSKVNIDNSTLNVEINGTTKIYGNVNLDFGTNYEDIKISLLDKAIDIKDDGSFVLNGVKFGDKLNVVSNNYHGVSQIELNDRNKLYLNFEKYYDLVLSVKFQNQIIDDLNLSLDIDAQIKENESGLISIDKLYGNCNLQIEKEGYKFEDNYSIKYADFAKDNQLNIETYKFYNVSGSIKSGDIILNNASIVVDGKSIEVNELGQFEIKNAYSTTEILASCNGYNSDKKMIDINNNNAEFDLSYDIEGTINCGKNQVVGNVKVLVDNKPVTNLEDGKELTTNKFGKFGLSNLRGKKILSFEKPLYKFAQIDSDQSFNYFDTLELTQSQNLELYSTYSIAGTASNAEGVIAGMQIILISVEKEDSDPNKFLYTNTNELGAFEFDGLSGEYLLKYNRENPDYSALKPTSYSITSAMSDCDFADGGFAFGGRVTCGDGVGVEGVEVSIGDKKTTTNQNGYYEFDLVTKNGYISLYKQGYTFKNNKTIFADNNIDGKYDQDFESTYEITGRIMSGKKALKDVQIFVNNELVKTTDDNGRFVIDKLTGKNDILVQLGKFDFMGFATIEDAKYIFDGNISTSTYTVINCNATFSTTLLVKTGYIAISDVQCKLNDVVIGSTDTQGKIDLPNVELDSVLSFSRENYNFEDFKVTEIANQININSTYRINGVVLNCEEKLSDVQIFVNGNYATTSNKDGKFEIDGLQGLCVISFASDLFKFKDIEVTKYEYLEILSEYEVSGNVYILGTETGVSGVVIKIDGKEVARSKGSKGFFQIKELAKKVTIECEKSGYEFSGDLKIVGPSDSLKIYATFSVAGVVKSGDILVENALVQVGDISTTTNAKGEFLLTGLSGRVALTITHEKYNAFVTDTIEDCMLNMIVDLSYNAQVEFYFATEDISTANYENIKVLINNKPYTEDGIEVVFNSKLITLKNLTGRSSISFTKTSYNFYYPFTMTCNDEVHQVRMRLTFAVSGTLVTKDSKKAIVGAKVYVVVDTDKDGNEVRVEDITKVDGSFKLEGLFGQKIIQATLPTLSATPKVYQGASFNNNTTDYTFAEISDFDFAYNLLTFGYEKLRKSNSYQIHGSGTVAPKGQDTQKIRVTYKKDSLGHKIFENKNIGNSIIGDTSVSLICYFNMLSDEVKYCKVEQGNVKEDKVNYSSWTNTNRAGIKNIGINYDGFSQYNINANTIKSVSNLNFDASTNNYTFAISLKCNSKSKSEEAYNDYGVLMKTMCDKAPLIGFSYINLNYTISQDGYIKLMSISENYDVDAPVIGALNTNANITYQFIINSMTEKIADIDISTPNTAFANLYTKETPTETQTLNTPNIYYSNNKFDLIMFKKEELLWKNLKTKLF